MNLQVLLLIDRANNGDESRLLVLVLGFEPIMPPEQNRRRLWAYDSETYKRRNAIKRIRRVLTSYERIDLLFPAVVTIVLIADQLD